MTASGPDKHHRRPAPAAEPPLVAWPVAVALALGASYVAGLLLAPSGEDLIAPQQVDAASAFTEAQLDRARGFRRPQILVGLGALAAQVALLGYLARRPPSWLLRLRHPLAGGAAAGAMIAGALAIAALPFELVGRLRSLDVGLSTRSWSGWLADQGLSLAVTALLAAVLASVAVGLIRRLGRWWWLPASGVVVLAAAVMLFAQPVALDPLFNRFRPLDDRPLREDAVALARLAGVEVGSVEVMDASIRTTGANAYVAGFGSTRRVVIYDNVVRDFPRPQIRSILAHEFAHQRFADLPGGLLYIALVAPFGLLAIDALQRRLAARRVGAPSGLPALALAFVVVSTGVTWISNGLSRRVEARADRWALEATRDAAAFSALHRNLALRNLSDPAPPRLVSTVLSTHPSTVDRLGMARSYVLRRAASDSP